jgi:hypothetical protein
MNHQYHRKTLIASDSQHPMVQEALGKLDAVEAAILQLARSEITVSEYITAITDYDRFMWINAKSKPQKSNPINTLQNKKYSTWREQKWAPIFERVRQSIQPLWQDVKLVVIQNKPVVETVYSNGYIAHKDVDGGLAIELEINGRKELVPVVAVEDKGGHACSTCFNGVNAQGLRLHQSFPNARHVFITDNNISVGQNKGAEIADHINLIVSERGQNRRPEAYPPLNAARFQEVMEGLIQRLSGTQSREFTTYEVIHSPAAGTLRSQIDQTGVVWNW